MYESVTKIFRPLKRAVYLAKENPLSLLTLIGIKGLSYIGNQSLTSKVMYCYECTESLYLTNPEIFKVSTIKDSNYKDAFNYSKGYIKNLVSKCTYDFVRIILTS